MWVHYEPRGLVIETENNWHDTRPQLPLFNVYKTFFVVRFFASTFCYPFCASHLPFPIPIHSSVFSPPPTLSLPFPPLAEVSWWCLDVSGLFTHHPWWAKAALSVRCACSRRTPVNHSAVHDDGWSAFALAGRGRSSYYDLWRRPKHQSDNGMSSSPTEKLVAYYHLQSTDHTPRNMLTLSSYSVNNSPL